VRILVIKHGAFGDFVLGFSALAAIRGAHSGAEMTLLTTAPYAGLLKASNWFDRIEIDSRPDPWNVPGLLRLRRQLRGYDLVYDLQTSARSSRYFALAGKPAWSGIAKGCALPHADPNRDHIHTRERLEGQLRDAGIASAPPADLAWLTGADVSGFGLPEEFALLVPGAAPHRPEKRWPEQNFAELARALPVPSVIVGGAGEKDLARAIPGLDLTGRTSLFELAAIAARAKIALGNDTGPMHLAAALGVPSVVLFSAASDPALTAPRYPDGGWPVVLRALSLQDLPVAQVLASLP
jgi:ADP-heptose:LPS heptosyltransferase